VFETLHDLDHGQLVTAAEALYANGSFAVLADPSGVYVLVKADPKLPYEVDFYCVQGAWKDAPPAPMSPLAYATIYEWSKRNIPAICKAWRAAHPDAHRKPGSEDTSRKMPRRKTRKDRSKDKEKTP
jgi:hypothetical protein